MPRDKKVTGSNADGSNFKLARVDVDWKQQTAANISKRKKQALEQIGLQVPKRKSATIVFQILHFINCVLIPALCPSHNYISCQLSLA